MKLRISKSEIDLLVERLKRQGQTKLSDTKVGSARVIEMSNSRIVFKSNGWTEIQSK